MGTRGLVPALLGVSSPWTYPLTSLGLGILQTLTDQDTISAIPSSSECPDVMTAVGQGFCMAEGVLSAALLRLDHCAQAKPSVKILVHVVLHRFSVHRNKLAYHTRLI